VLAGLVRSLALGAAAWLDAGAAAWLAACASAWPAPATITAATSAHRAAIVWIPAPVLFALMVILVVPVPSVSAGIGPAG